LAEITYLTWTDDSLLRQTVYVGLREDKPAEQVRRERAKHAGQ
jgi:bifunctional non-homologous end joining protein LigD